MYNLLSAAADVYFGFCIAFMILLVIASISMIVIVLIQRGDANNNISALTGGTDTFFGRNKTRTIDNKFKLATVVIASSMVVFSILFFVFQVLLNKLG
jgi:preprotein translocase subunit SecG